MVQYIFPQWDPRNTEGTGPDGPVLSADRPFDGRCDIVPQRAAVRRGHDGRLQCSMKHIYIGRKRDASAKTVFDKSVACFFLIPALLMASGCAPVPEEKNYGVLLSETEDLGRLAEYETVVIDAQYFSKREIDAFRLGGHRVYSYINIGSLEDFRGYFGEYEDLILGPYENWDGEYWVDVSNEKWQSFMIDELAPSLLQKDVDGFFVDNCDVYYHFPTRETMGGLAAILHTLVGTGRPVLINGGDAFVDAYCAAGGQWNEVMTGINQETVFSKILWDGDKFGTASDEDRAYFMDYIERYAAVGVEIYLLEYTKSRSLAAKIREYCAKNGFEYYISDSIELD